METRPLELGDDRAEVARMVRAIAPCDAVEAAHRTDALSWLASGADIVRGRSAQSRRKHLVCYIQLIDVAERATFLVLHRKAGLWMPAGGHVEPGEHPADTVRREAIEELGIEARFAEFGPEPVFVTVTETVDRPEHRHVDVSLWFVITGSRSEPLTPDRREFTDARWWTRRQLDAMDPDAGEPHLRRFLSKVETLLV